MPVLTLLTDFGLRDGFIGMMKGVIAGICPQAQVIDITHAIRPQDVREGAFVLRRAAPYFPAGSVHVAVVDPGVGTSRGAVAVAMHGQIFVAPDNGLLWPLVQEALTAGQEVQAVRLENRQYWRQGEISRTFHGRDVFSPVGAHLACGVPLDALGPGIQPDDLERLPWFAPQRVADGWEAHVQYIDHFGNVYTDLDEDHLHPERDFRIRASGVKLTGLVPSYGHGQPGQIIALINSDGWLEIACVNGNAAQRLGLQVGETIYVEYL